MQAHGMTGRRYAGRILQIITGAIGLDAWEWGVTLFAKDPLDFKKLVTDMRFDEVSATYADFGDFYVGRSCLPATVVTPRNPLSPAYVGQSTQPRGRAMWSAIRWIVLRLAAIRWLFKLGGLGMLAADRAAAEDDRASAARHPGDLGNPAADPAVPVRTPDLPRAGVRRVADGLPGVVLTIGLAA